MDGKSMRKRARDSLVEAVRGQVARGELLPGQAMLSVSELATKYGVSSRAVREGLAHLEAEGLVHGGQGRRTIVVSREPASLDAVASRNIAVVFQGRVRDNTTAEDLDGLQQAIQAEGYGTILYVADGSPEKEAEIVGRLAKEGVPGLVLYSAHPADSFEHLRAAQQAGMKIVVYDHDFPDLDINFAGLDDHLAAREAAEHLIRLGCKELLLINSDRNWTSSRLRQSGFEEAAGMLGSSLPARIVRLPAYQTVAEYDKAIRRALFPVLDTLQRPLGILAWWDEIALRVIELLQQAGWSVPADAKVMGIGNDLGGELAEPRLSTMASPREDISRLAASVLVSQMRDPSRRPQKIRLKARMIIRESCGNYDPHVLASLRRTSELLNAAKR